MESPETAVRSRFDLTLNIPTILLLLTVMFSVTGAWFHLTENQKRLEDTLAAQSQMNAAVLKRVGQLNHTMTVWDERMSSFPLHAHVGKAIVYPDGKKPSPDLPAEDKEKDP